LGILGAGSTDSERQIPIAVRKKPQVGRETDTRGASRNGSIEPPVVNHER